MFARVCVLTVVTVALWALLVHDSGASGPEQRYRVRPGDTLWSIAAAHFAGDPRKGVWVLQQRNGLRGTLIVPGQTLALP
jgi:LysM repeat protein